MLPQPREEAKVFRQNEDNLFNDYNTIEGLIKGYQTYVRKYGTSHNINFQYHKRLAELDILVMRGEL